MYDVTKKVLSLNKYNTCISFRKLEPIEARTDEGAQTVHSRPKMNEFQNLYEATNALRLITYAIIFSVLMSTRYNLPT